MELSDRSGVQQDQELIERIRNGDADAFEQLARREAPKLMRLALKLCQRREDAEDLVQETLLKSMTTLRRFDGRAQLSTYLFRALSNQWKNRLRSRSRSRIVDWFRGQPRGDDRAAPSIEPREVDPAPDAEQQLVAGERALEIRAAIETLEPHRRLTLLLREVEGLSYEEIAMATDVAVGTVRSRLARARADLKQRLGGEA